MFTAVFQRLIVLASALLLAACAGTIQRESNAGPRRIENARYSAVDVVLTEEVRRAQGDNPQFSVKELGDYIRRRLEGRDLITTQGSHRVEVTIEHVRVRSIAAAVILGFMAGADSIDGYVRVYDGRGRQVHGYKVNASYALGGYAGGQDGMRMNWLYDKFSELAVAELAGATPAAAVAKGRAQPASPPPPGPAVAITPPAAPAPAPAAAPVAAVTVAAAPAPEVPTAAAPAKLPKPIASGFATIDDIDAIPYLGDRGRKKYAEWLGWSTPRAFAISARGSYYATSGLTPKDTSLPSDPSQRALLMCERAGQGVCKLYAVNGSVVWKPEP
jgi:hypothetical protein